jgi:hypothetical protein
VDKSCGNVERALCQCGYVDKMWTTTVEMWIRLSTGREIVERMCITIVEMWRECYVNVELVDKLSTRNVHNSERKILPVEKSCGNVERALCQCEYVDKMWITTVEMWRTFYLSNSLCVI